MVRSREVLYVPSSIRLHAEPGALREQLHGLLPPLRLLGLRSRQQAHRLRLGITFDPEAELGGRGAVLADEAAEEAARHGEASRPLPGPRGRRHRRSLSSLFPAPPSSKSPRRRLQLRPQLVLSSLLAAVVLHLSNLSPPASCEHAAPRRAYKGDPSFPGRNEYKSPAIKNHGN